jgi:hypothetical protein
MPSLKLIVIIGMVSAGVTLGIQHYQKTKGG